MINKDYEDQNLKSFVKRYAPQTPEPPLDLEDKIILKIKNHSYDSNKKFLYKFSFKFALVAVVLILLFAIIVYFKMIPQNSSYQNDDLTDVEEFIEEVWVSNTTFNDMYDLNFELLDILK